MTTLLDAHRIPARNARATRTGRGVRLHVRRIFIMEDSGQLMPRYLRFIRGVIDSADLPLNVRGSCCRVARHELVRVLSTREHLELLRHRDSPRFPPLTC